MWYLKNSPTHPQNNRKASNANSTTIKLIVPASQCGSLIGKGGVKIREIREASGAMVNVASDLLPNSTERTVSISGSAEAITEAIHQICVVMLEVCIEIFKNNGVMMFIVLYNLCWIKTPGRGPTVAYRPLVTQPGPVVLCGGQAYTLQGTLAIPAVGDVNIIFCNKLKLRFLLINNLWLLFIEHYLHNVLILNLNKYIVIERKNGYCFHLH